MPVIINGTTGLSGVSTVNLANGSVTQNILANGVAGTGPAFGVYRSSNQSISGTVLTKIQFDVEEFDTGNCFDNTTNYRFTPNVSGYYQINAAWEIAGAPGSGGQVAIILYKNGAAFKWGMYGPNSVATPFSAVVSSLVYCNGTTDYIEIYAYVANANNVQGGQLYSYANGFLARAA